VLFFNFYSSSPSDAGKSDTEFTVTNTNASQSTAVHAFFIQGSSGSAADVYFCLAPNQTLNLLGSDLDPGTTGYVLMVASDQVTGCPISFNFLIGSDFVKLGSGHAASLSAESYRALFNGPLPEYSRNASVATLSFDGVSYSKAPRMLAVDRFFSPLEGNSTILVANKFGGDLNGNATRVGEISGAVFDFAGNAFQFNMAEIPAQLIRTISDDFPQTTPKLTEYVPQGKTGWIRLMAKDEQAISGAVINFNPGAATMQGRFNGGHNLHPLDYTSAAIIIPIFPPLC